MVFFIFFVAPKAGWWELRAGRRGRLFARVLTFIAYLSYIMMYE
jgi:hypothetical protein